MDPRPDLAGGRAGHDSSGARGLMRVLVATDAWHPQTNGVVQTLRELARAAPQLGASIAFLTPEGLPSLPLPTYPDIRLAMARPRAIARRIVDLRPAAIHISTEGPIGVAVRQYCRRNGLTFTTSFHTRFPEYVAARMPIPESWTWAALRWFHGAAGGVMAATPALESELVRRGFANVTSWPRGVDAALFRPRPGVDLGLARPVFLTVGRLAIEKNLEAFLALDLPGTKVVVGDGPLRRDLARRFPDAVFLGTVRGEELARAYAAADVFVFPSRTDTYGLVLLEALASGVPVAAFPVSGPRDVLADAPVAALDADLRAACLGALTLSREECRAFALERSWDTSARIFLANVRRVGLMAAVAAGETSKAVA
jgi:1,2-diacylglycerol 3-alpha-glucosyltransferase/glucuronosyltransferase